MGKIRQTQVVKEYDQQTYAIIGAAMEVHKCLGAGFLEPVYQDALEIELTERSVPFEREKKLVISYKGKPLPGRYQADFVCFNDIIVELKALNGLGPIEESQILNYLKATGFRRGLLINFGTPRLQNRRFVNG
jgi:GxxExxY protein